MSRTQGEAESQQSHLQWDIDRCLELADPEFAWILVLSLQGFEVWASVSYEVETALAMGLCANMACTWALKELLHPLSGLCMIRVYVCTIEILGAFG